MSSVEPPLHAETLAAFGKRAASSVFGDNSVTKNFRNGDSFDSDGNPIVGTEAAMAVLKCPVCGSDAVDSDQQETTLPTADANIVVCHCSMSHRFLVAVREDVPSQPKSNDPSFCQTSDKSESLRAAQVWLLFGLSAD